MRVANPRGSIACSVDAACTGRRRAHWPRLPTFSKSGAPQRSTLAEGPPICRQRPGRRPCGARRHGPGAEPELGMRSQGGLLRMQGGRVNLAHGCSCGRQDQPWQSLACHGRRGTAGGRISLCGRRTGGAGGRACGRPALRDRTGATAQARPSCTCLRPLGLGEACAAFWQTSRPQQCATVRPSRQVRRQGGACTRQTCTASSAPCPPRCP